MKKPKPLKWQETLIAIHRHWIWAERIQLEYFSRIKNNPEGDDDLLKFFLTGHGMYLCLWFSLEFFVCEALRLHKLVVPNAQEEIKEIYQTLKEFRNTVFHIQPDYFSKKMFKLLNDAKHQTTILRVHKETGRWLSDEIGTANRNRGL